MLSQQYLVFLKTLLFHHFMSPETSNYGQFLFDSQERVILEPVAEGQFSKGHNMSYNHDIQIL